MSYQAYINSLENLTGKSVEDFKELAKQEGLLEPGVKPGEIVEWLKKEFNLGHGHSMALYGLFKHLGFVNPSQKPKQENKVKIKYQSRKRD